MTFNLLEQTYMVFYSLNNKIVPNYIEKKTEKKTKNMHKWKSSGLDKLNLRSFDSSTLKCDFDLQPTCTNVSRVTFTH